jgi:hypothetical protein
LTLYEKFVESKEQGFREEFIKPLLVQMGFVGISNKHGSQEFGKDYVFSEVDRFGHFRHMAVQAKHEKKIDQGPKVDGLISQVRQCFNSSYTLPSAPLDRRHVAAVYVFNTGEITPNAERQIIDSLPREQGSNTHFFSGPQLEILSNTLGRRQNENIRERLQAFRTQLALNVKIWMSVREEATNVEEAQIIEVRGGIFHGMEEWLSLPLVPELIDINEIGLLWQEAKIIQSIALRQATRELKLSQNLRHKESATLVEICNRAINRAVNLSQSIAVALASMPATLI